MKRMVKGILGVLMALMLVTGAAGAWPTWAAGTWAPVGTAGFSAGDADSPSLAIYDGTPYVAYADFANGSKATVMKYDGTNWVNVGSAGFSAGAVLCTSLAIYEGTPYVAYGDVANGDKATVMKYDGTNWVNVGSAGFSAGATVYTSLAISGGTPYVAYEDLANGNKATVMKYDGTNWVNVGSAGFSAGMAYSTSLAISGGTPYVAYTDDANGSKATVMKYDGTNWVNVGSAGFSAGQTDYTSLAISGGTPYVAYWDDANGGKATVMKYDGTNWVNVGSAGFSAGDAGTTSLAISGGTPYVAYRDNANGGKATVMKYDGTNWVNAGSAGFSADMAFETSLAVYEGTPYVAYSDGANDFKATVMKYTPNAPPVAVEDAYNAKMTTQLDGSTVLGNDTDADGDTLTASVVTEPAMDAAFTFNADGTFSYTPVDGFQGVDTFTYKANDGSEDSNEATVSITVSPNVSRFISNKTNDGWVRESSETSGTGGYKYADMFLRAGDTKQNMQYRSVVSFTTPALPDGAVILKVTVKIMKYTQVAGTDPFTTHGNLLADIKKGSFGTAALQVTDFEAPATKSGVGIFKPVAGVPGLYQMALEKTSYQYINWGGVTQFRLRFALDDDNDGVEDMLRFFGGETTVAKYRPVLLIEYYVPLP